ncbi:MAG: DUF1579 family protein [Phycisphaerales bacterium]|nr:DUF1579 family protein [Phycisphaerales bacterium]
MSDHTDTMPEELAACAAVGKTSQEHELLKQFVGQWDSKVTIWFGEGQSHTSEGVMTNEMDLGGRFLKHTYSDSDDYFHGRGFWGYNTLDKRWEGFWIDDMATFFQVDHGQHDPKTNTWEMTGNMTDPGSGTPMHKRTVITVKDADHHSMETYFTPTQGEHAGQESKCMEIQYSRKP